jgi:hypothetical protein
MMEAIQPAFLGFFVTSYYEQNILLLVVTRYAYNVTFCPRTQILLPPAFFFIVVNYLEVSILKIDTNLAILILV